jgi:hypothetical protein
MTAITLGSLGHVRAIFPRSQVFHPLLLLPHPASSRVQFYSQTQKPGAAVAMLRARVLPLYRQPAPSPLLLATANWLLGEYAEDLAIVSHWAPSPVFLNNLLLSFTKLCCCVSPCTSVIDVCSTSLVALLSILQAGFALSRFSKLSTPGYGSCPPSSTLLFAVSAFAMMFLAI